MSSGGCSSSWAATSRHRDIATARKRRNLTIAVVAERALVGRNTITRVEHGDPGVALGLYATVLFVLGLSARIADLVDPQTDDVGTSLEIERLPIRVRTPAIRS